MTFSCIYSLMFTINCAYVRRGLWDFILLNHFLSFSCSFYLASIPRDMPLTWIIFESIWCNMNSLLSQSLIAMERNDDLLRNTHHARLNNPGQDSTVRDFWLGFTHRLNHHPQSRRWKVSAASGGKKEKRGTRGRKKCWPKPQPFFPVSVKVIFTAGTWATIIDTIWMYFL